MRHADGRKVAIPNPHKGDLDWSLVGRMLRHFEITVEQWEEFGRK